MLLSSFGSVASPIMAAMMGYTVMGWMLLAVTIVFLAAAVFHWMEMFSTPRRCALHPFAICHPAGYLLIAQAAFSISVLAYYLAKMLSGQLLVPKAELTSTLLLVGGGGAVREESLLLFRNVGTEITVYSAVIITTFAAIGVVTTDIYRSLVSL